MPSTIPWKLCLVVPQGIVNVPKHLRDHYSSFLVLLDGTI